MTTLWGWWWRHCWYFDYNRYKHDNSDNGDAHFHPNSLFRAGQLGQTWQGKVIKLWWVFHQPTLKWKTTNWIRRVGLKNSLCSQKCFQIATQRWFIRGDLSGRSSYPKLVQVSWPHLTSVISGEVASKSFWHRRETPYKQPYKALHFGLRTVVGK